MYSLFLSEISLCITSENHQLKEEPGTGAQIIQAKWERASGGNLTFVCLFFVLRNLSFIGSRKVKYHINETD